MMVGPGYKVGTSKTITKTVVSFPGNFEYHRIVDGHLIMDIEVYIAFSLKHSA